MFTTYLQNSALAVISRLFLALVGGYLLTHAIVLVLVVIVNRQGQDALLMGMTLSFLLYAAVIIWVYATVSLRKAWMNVSVLTLIFGTLWWLSGGGV